jgi:hypothetical protein
MVAYIRSLTYVEQLLDAVELKIEYPYDDLVFVENNPFLLRFDNADSKILHLHFNQQCQTGYRHQLSLLMAQKADQIGIKLNQHADYSFKQHPDKELVDIVFEKAL